jgi:S1-C subfamily serine protease
VVTGLQRNSVPARIGLRPNDLIVQVDGRLATSVAALGRAQRGSELTIVRGGRKLTGRLP